MTSRTASPAATAALAALAAATLAAVASCFARPAVACERAAQDQPARHVLVASGLGGEDYFRDLFRRWSGTFVAAASERLGLPESCVRYLAETRAAGDEDTVEPDGTSRKEQVLAALEEMRSRSRPGDLILVLLVGHGTARDGQALFNIPGPDLSSRELATALDGLADREQVVVVGTSASGAFLEDLRAPGRVVITATASGYENRHARFPESFVNAYTAPEADTDKNGRVSVREAFEFARREVASLYAKTKRLQTEHALLEDGADGELAARLHLEPDRSLTALRAASPRTLELERITRSLLERIETLKRERRGLSAEEYETELETLLLQLAVNRRSLREEQQQ